MCCRPTPSWRARHRACVGAAAGNAPAHRAGPVVPLYDYIFIDCAPSLDLLTVNALCAADTVIIPMQCEFFALEGLSELMATLKTVRKSTTGT